jgi:hypothetical protein
MRVCLVIVLLCMLTVATLSQSFLMAEKVKCLEDKLFVYTDPINKYFQQHIQAKHAFMIVCGLMMDIMVLVQVYRFALQGSTWRLPMAFIAFYGLRAIMQVWFYLLC